MELVAFKANWGVSEIPIELETIIDFQQNVSGNYSKSFGIINFDRSLI